MDRRRTALLVCEVPFATGTSAIGHFERIISNRRRRVCDGHLPGLTEQDCHDQQAILTSVLHPELEDAPFAMDHGDLSPQNILVDSAQNITGIIDWGFAAKVPIHCRYMDDYSTVI
ncbi:phosphotransferase enzyme family protein [Hirsutella rhossiliensis]